MERKISAKYIRIGKIGSLVHRITCIVLSASSLQDWLYALLPGFFFIIIARITKEKIGFGDGLVLLILGNFLSYKELLYVLQSALIFMMMFSILMLISKKADGKCKIPFLPFLWMSHTLLWRLCYG